MLGTANKASHLPETYQDQAFSGEGTYVYSCMGLSRFPLEQVSSVSGYWLSSASSLSPAHKWLSQTLLCQESTTSFPIH